jgi:hypothetical protein
MPLNIPLKPQIPTFLKTPIFEKFRFMSEEHDLESFPWTFLKNPILLPGRPAKRVVVTRVTLI